VLRFTLTAKGRACHSSDPGKGRSAIVAISEAVLALQDFFTTELSKITRAEFGCSTGSVGVIEGGSGVNIVPERCAVQVDIRLVPGQKPLESYAAMQSCVKEKCRRVPEIEWSFSEPTVVEVAYDTPADTELIKTACRVLDCPTPLVVLYSCDASTIAACGVPTAVIGPGQIEQAHTAQESVAVQELRGAVGLYTKLARELLK
jgi:acetylornithine deacetylase/succinyl-diaminopimelate desuccinylase-like protein